jgi:phage terminase large subunit-like protein
VTTLTIQLTGQEEFHLDFLFNTWRSMRLEKLKELYNTCRTVSNYQYKDLPEEEFLTKAKKSFQRLPDQQKKKVLASWYDKLSKDSATTDPESDTNDLLKYRFMAQTNLFFLCHLLEKYNQTTIQTHEEICNKFFVQKDPTFTTFEAFANQYTDLKERMLLVPRNGFKALSLDTKIPTPTGMSTISDLKVGDTVFDDNGKQCKVVGKSDVFTERPCYEVAFSSGERIIADEDHLWITDSRKDRDRLKGRNGKTTGPRPSVKTTKEIFDTIYCREEYNHRVKVAGPLDIEEKEYTVPPYVLGCWLGDGTSANSNFACNDPQIIEEIRKEGEVIREAGYGKYLYVFNGGKDHASYKNKSGKSLASRLRNLELINNKHIPEEYLRGSYSQRLSLLQGLMDTDGTCDKTGRCSFTNKNKELIIQVRELIASLGMKPYKICEFESFCGDKPCGMAYQVGFIAHKEDKVFRLQRKLDRLNDKKRGGHFGNRSIVSVSKVESVPTQCISVDSYNHTYLVGRSFIPTHNSSIDIADCVQWTICFPEVTILILTGVYKLATDFVGEAKQHFTMDQATNKESEKGKASYGARQLMDKLTGEWTDSLFQILFAEHCVTPTDGSQLEFQTPAGGDDKEPTIRAASIEQALSGMHFGVLKLDDVVTNENSGTEDRIEKINKQISINKAMLNPYGFFDVIGTWYDNRDFYGVTISQEEQFAKDEGLLDNIKGSVDSGRFNSHVFVKVYLRAGWWPTEDAAKAGKIEEEMKKEDWVLWFPERLTYEFLTLQKKKDTVDGAETGNFAIKYLNNPRKINRVKFPRELLVRRTIPHNQFPPQGVIVTTVDTAYSTKSWADYTVIMTALIFGGRFYIINMVRGRFNEYDLPKIIANTANKWKPKRIAIEDSVGVKWMGRELRREMDSLRISIPVEFVSLGLGSKLRSKQLKAKPVLRLLGDERLFFLNSCEGLEEIYNELEKFTGTSDDQHDDIVSAVSLLVEQFIGYADMDSRVNSIQSDYVSNRQSKEAHDRMYCLGKYAQQGQDDNPTTTYQLQNSLDAQSEPYVDPFADLV